MTSKTDLLINTRSRKIDVDMRFIDAPKFKIGDALFLGMNLFIKDKEFLCLSKKSGGLNKDIKPILIGFPEQQIADYLADFYDIRDFGDPEQDPWAEFYMIDLQETHLRLIKQKVLDKFVEWSDNYIDSLTNRY